MESLFISSPRAPPTSSRTVSSVDLSHHLNDVARRRKPSPLKEMAKYMGVPGMTSLAGGMPL